MACMSLSHAFHEHGHVREVGVTAVSLSRDHPSELQLRPQLAREKQLHGRQLVSSTPQKETQR
eukprot:5007464-Amphidinium_carterae.1